MSDENNPFSVSARLADPMGSMFRRLARNAPAEPEPPAESKAPVEPEASTDDVDRALEFRRLHAISPFKAGAYAKENLAAIDRGDKALRDYEQKLKPQALPPKTMPTTPEDSRALIAYRSWKQASTWYVRGHIQEQYGRATIERGRRLDGGSFVPPNALPDKPPDEAA